MTTQAVRVFRGGTATLDVYDYGDSAQVANWQALGGSAGDDVFGVGFSTCQGEFDWHLEYDAVYYVVAGTITVTMDGTVYVAHTGDILRIQRGSRVTYGSTDGCKVFWVVQPSNWEELSDFTIPRGESG